MRKKIREGLEGFSREDIILYLLGIFYMSGIFGFVYEEIFYYFNDGFLSKRGSGFGPWIQLYGFGGWLIIATCWWFRKHWWQVLVLSGLFSGILEYATGYVQYNFNNHHRSWDYNTEIWNWGNVDGYICFRSIAFFALCGIILVYVLVPILRWVQGKVKPLTFKLFMALPAAVFFLDILYNDFLKKLF